MHSLSHCQQLLHQSNDFLVLDGYNDGGRQQNSVTDEPKLIQKHTTGGQRQKCAANEGLISKRQDGLAGEILLFADALGADMQEEPEQNITQKGKLIIARS